MYLLRVLLARLLVFAVILGVGLWILARTIQIDRHRDAIVSRINGTLSGFLSVDRLELMLVPHLGVRAKGVSLASRTADGTLSPVLYAPTVDVRVSLRTLFRPTREVLVWAPSAKLTLEQLPNRTWNLEPLLPGERLAPVTHSTPSKPPASPRKSKVEEEIEARSRMLAAGQFSKGSAHPVPPKATSVPKTPSITPTPAPERVSLFETIRLTEIQIQKTDVTWSGHNGLMSSVLALGVRIQPTRSTLEVEFPSALSASSPLGTVIQTCKPSSSVHETGHLSVRADQMDIKNWNLGPGTETYSGTLQWSGPINLRSQTQKISGTLEHPLCAPAP